jgi:hypothetical protein
MSKTSKINTKQALVNCLRHLDYIDRESLKILLVGLVKDPAVYIRDLLRDASLTCTNNFIHLSERKVTKINTIQNHHRLIIFKILLYLELKGDVTQIKVESEIIKGLQPDISCKIANKAFYFEADTGHQNKEVIMKKISNYNKLTDYHCVLVTSAFSERRLIDYPNTWTLHDFTSLTCAQLQDTITKAIQEHTQHTSTKQNNEETLDLSSLDIYELATFARSI